jgi:flagellar hook-associated protein 3 FlgL
MITGLSPANEQFLVSVDNLQARLNDAQNQLSSGLRVNKPSDAPQEVADIFQTRSDLARITQVDQNLGTVKAQVDAADSSLQSAVQLLQNAAVLGTQGGSTSASASFQQSLASQVQSVEAQLVALSRTQVNGVYIFSGDSSGSPAYQVNTSSPTGVDRLITSPATAQVADTTGVTFQVARTAQDLFDKRDSSDNPAPGNAFAALQNLQTALQSGDTNAISQAIAGVNTASDYLNQQLSFYGAAQNRINSSIDLAQKFQVQSQSQLSTLQDANVPSEALQLTQATTSLDAAMAAQGKRPVTTLFDYLPIQ